MSLIKKIQSVIYTNKEGFKCKYTCMVATPYALSLYLIYMPEDALDNTFFCVYDQINADIIAKLPHVRVFNHIANANKKTFWRFRIVALIKYFFIRFTDIYAMDFLDFSPQLIGTSKYTCLEDGTGSFTFAENSEVLSPFALPRNFWGFKRRLQHGSIYGKVMGDNKQCINRLITSPADSKSSLIRGRKYTLVNFEKEWVNSSVLKQNNIENIFSIHKDEIEIVKQHAAVILTQPLGSKVTEQEKVDIYAPYIMKYKEFGVVIKPHPAETTDYTRYFPDVLVWKTKAPMQLLTAMGVKFRVAVTIFSTAVGTLPDDTEIIWLGTKVNKKLFEDVGPVSLEQVVRR